MISSARHDVPNKFAAKQHVAAFDDFFFRGHNRDVAGLHVAAAMRSCTAWWLNPDTFRNNAAKKNKVVSKNVDDVGGLG